MEEVLTLSCDNFDRKCPKAFRELWLDQKLSDVTLATEDGGQIAAHKVILSTSSPLFKRLLQRNPNSHPLLYLMGIQLIEVEQLLSYIYLGKCDLTQAQLPAFMAAGKLLEIDGLDLGDKEFESEAAYKQKEEHLGLFVQNHSPEDKFSALDANDTRNMEGGTQNLIVGLEESSHDSSKDEHVAVTEECTDMSMANVKTEIAVETHNLKVDGNKGQCQFCDYRPANRRHLNQHVRNVHQGLKYECMHCDYKTGDKSNLKKHIEKTHMGITYSCSICQQVFNLKERLKRHVDVKHNGLHFDCPNCEYKSTKKSTLHNHISVHHNGVTFDCNVCTEKFTSRQNLARHIKIVHEELRYQCQECDEVFRDKGAVKRHVKGVHKGVKYECDMCDVKFSYPDSVTTHKKNVHFKATFHGPKTLTETIFSMMIEYNTGWQCGQCGHKSKSKDKKANKALVKAHIEAEHMGLTYTCDICGLTFRSREGYRSHLQTKACNVKNLE